VFGGLDAPTGIDLVTTPTLRLISSLAALAALAACCTERQNPPVDVYVPVIEPDQVLGEWSLPKSERGPIGRALASLLSSPQAPRVLTIQAEGACSLSQNLAEVLIRCEHAEPDAKAHTASCGWRVDGKPGAQWLQVTFEAPGGTWLLTHFSVYENTSTQELWLAGTCGLGDAYGLYRLRDGAAERGDAPARALN
jgi:hypothetical protein